MHLFRSGGSCGRHLEKQETEQERGEQDINAYVEPSGLALDDLLIGFKRHSQFSEHLPVYR